MPEQSEVAVESRGPSALAMATYLTTIFLGCGVFAVGTEAGRIGLLRVVVLLIGIMPFAAMLYVRLGRALADMHGSDSGIGAVFLALPATGSAAKWLGTIAVDGYAIPAVIAYGALATYALHQTAALGAPGVLMGCAGGCAGVLLVTQVLGLVRTEAVARLMRLAMSWSAGLVAMRGLDWLGAPGVTVDIVAWMAFVAGCATIQLGPRRDPVTERSSGRVGSAVNRAGLAPEHRSSIAAMVIQFGLMLVIVVLALLFHHGVAASHQNASPNQSQTDFIGWVRALSTVLFLHVSSISGASARYKRLRDPKVVRRVMWLALAMVTLVLLLWTIPVDLLYGQSGLGTLLKTNSNTVISIALVASNSTVKMILTVLGGFVALVGTSNASLGFSGSMVLEWSAARSQKQTVPPDQKTLNRITVGCIALVAGVGTALAATVSNAVMPIIETLPASASAVLIFSVPLLAGRRPASALRALVLAGGAVSAALAGGGAAVAMALTNHFTEKGRAPWLFDCFKVAALAFGVIPAVVTLWAAVRFLATRPAEHLLPSTPRSLPARSSGLVPDGELGVVSARAGTRAATLRAEPTSG